jgi:hypothetical protein
MQPMSTTRENAVNRAGKAVVLAVATLTLAGCGKKAATEAPLPAIATAGKAFGGAAWEAQKIEHDRNVSAGAGRSFANVTYKPEVKIVDEPAVVAALVGVSSDGHGAVFKNAPPAVLALKAGDIFMVKNQFAVKVLGAETDGEQTVLIIDQAKLVDLIQQGEINLDTPISFHGPKLAARQAAAPRAFEFMDLIAAPAYAQSGPGARQDTTNYNGQPSELQPGYNTPQPGVTSNSATDQAKDFAKDLASGWTVERWSVTPGPDSAAISARLTKDTAGFLAAIAMDGTISNFGFAQHLKFPVDTTQVINGVKGMSGQMHFTWEVGKGTPGVWAVEDKLKLPAGVNIPLGPLLGGLPLTLDISAALLIHPALTGGNEYEKGGFTLGWNGEGNSEGLTFQITEDQSISPIAPNGMVIAFCVPRVELQVAPLGPFASINGISTMATVIDAIVRNASAKILSPQTLNAIHQSPFGNFSVSNALSSKADIFVQIIHTEGATHSANTMSVSCSKVELKVDGQYGGDAQLLGMTPGATTTKPLFTKTLTHWTPHTDLCVRGTG